MKKVKKWLVAMLCLSCISSGSMLTVAASELEKTSIQENVMDNEAMATGIIGEEDSKIITKSVSPKGACTLVIRAIGSGLLDCEWSIFMSTHKISYIGGLIGLDYYNGSSSRRTLDVTRHVSVWRNQQEGVEQTSFSPGTYVSGEFFGTVTLNATIDYPFSTYATRTVTIE